MYDLPKRDFLYLTNILNTPKIGYDNLKIKGRYVYMQYSVGVEYALHCLVYLIDVPSNDSIGIKDLAEFQGLPETFLSKVFSKLSKAGIVSSVPGVKGGYRLSRSPEDISFWDVVEAVEGRKPIFQCKNIKDNGYLYRENCCSAPSSCTIN